MAQAGDKSPWRPTRASPAPVLSFVRGSGNPGHALHNAQAAGNRSECRRLWAGRASLSSMPAFEQGHGFPIPCFRNHYLPNIALPILLAAGFTARALPLPLASSETPEKRQCVNDGEQYLLLGSVRTVAKLQHKWRNKTQVFLLGYRPKDRTNRRNGQSPRRRNDCGLWAMLPDAGANFPQSSPRVHVSATGNGQSTKSFAGSRHNDYRNVVHAGFNHGCRQICAGRTVRDAEKFLIRAIAIYCGQVPPASRPRLPASRLFLVTRQIRLKRPS